MHFEVFVPPAPLEAMTHINHERELQSGHLDRDSQRLLTHDPSRGREGPRGRHDALNTDATALNPEPDTPINGHAPRFEWTALETAALIPAPNATMIAR